MPIRLSIDDLEADSGAATSAPPGFFQRDVVGPPPGLSGGVAAATGLPPGFAPPLREAARSSVGRPFIVTGKSGVVVRAEPGLGSASSVEQSLRGNTG